MVDHSFLSLTKKRHSTFIFSKKKVSIRKVNRILEAGRWSPSVQNLQHWKFIVVRDPQKIARLSSSAAYGFFHTAPPVLVLIQLKLSLISAENRGIKNNLLGSMETLIGIGCCAMNIVLEATDNGIQSCLLSPRMDAIRKVVPVNSDDFIPIMIALGYESKETKIERPSRKKLSELVVYDPIKGGSS